MRRSAVVRLTLLPMLATAAVAGADAPPAGSPSNDPPSNAPGTVAPSVVPDSAFDGVPPEFDTTFAPPGMTEPVLAPPGMTPPLDCDASEGNDPDWDERPECTVSGGVIRGGFGHYFWVGGG
jgi:hypothetical protein